MEKPFPTYVQGQSLTFLDSFDKIAEKFPERDACIVYHAKDVREAVTFSELRKQSIQFAIMLLTKGLRKGDIVGLLSTNSVDFVVAFLGLSRIGAPVLMLRYGSTAEEVCSLLTKHDCKGLVGSIYSDRDAEVITNIEQKMSREHRNNTFIVISQILLDKRSALCSSKTDGENTNLSHIPEEMHFPKVGPDDACAIFFTSGSTGEPKAIQNNHRAFVARTRIMREFSFTEAASFFNDRPMAWTGGAYTILNMCIFGTCAVTINSNFTVASGEVDFVMTILRDEKCTHAILMNYLLVDFMHSNNPNNKPSHLKYVLTGGQKADHASLVHVLTALPTITLVYLYGVGEAGIVLYQCHTDTSTLDDDGFNIHQGADIKLINSSGETVEPGASGEICIRSPALFEGYHNNSEATSKARLPDNWFRSGDVGVKRQDGRIVLLGRSDDMIKRATVKVFPVEVERVLRQHPCIKEVVVVGVPDQRLFEDLCACIIPRDPKAFDEADFLIWCKAQFSVGPDGLSLAPSYVLVFDQFPKTSTGKTSRKDLKEVAKERVHIV
ncbi:oxalate--CoA ligase-like [Lingula anatina]|uniref:Oxalate--CoA ligase-like n=1 Tax=Lingula anatina TaxID=7574 RepID=A0A1S3JS48_LINAN|nr:oxalate--CoA ligase-like [Lingula anatina]|eukprot:XP_013412834.1 oxalate--CoA ligase-like [Lingula anatina]